MASTSTPQQSADWKELQDALMRVGEYLQKPTRLVVIGSSVAMWYGQPGRMTEDVDIWAPRSDLDLADISQACEKAGINFDPQGYDDHHGGLYLQMVKPGVVHVGKYRDDTHMFRSGNLEVVHPPVANIVASKLVRAAAHDLDDAIFLMGLGVTLDDVRGVIASFSGYAREAAEENLVFLEAREAILGDVKTFAEREGAQKKMRRSARP